MKLEKITNNSESQRRRWYDDACGAAHGLDLLGERWSLLVMRELMFGPKRFGDLRAGLPGISANILTQRLEGLEAAGVLLRRRLPPPASTQVYELTEWGRESEAIFQALGRWAVRSPMHDPSLPFSAASLMLSFRTMLDAERAQGIEARIGFRLGREEFRAELKAGRIEITAGPAEGADATFTGEPRSIAAAVYGGQRLEALEEAGALSIEGDHALARWFTSLFPLPSKAEIPRP
ncbi:winged helix-turn-helix transcriptional regulator [Roseomonas xinghualingensis]|uniref:winged helix-turn-helix transcriptional regulator n=1 Tax=Roseomonas xinghualingensis TaxID=2986475 RepID=UPI0021F22041|nr:winged helix-turn-helix transcriptional regulator [Roseomonas sp. SXEYE001]MCV4207008.1 winged helix-turn-helix transcriptional regulator [Roseomonas sp. SXEYE001]